MPSEDGENLQDGESITKADQVPGQPQRSQDTP